jgi:hypothetical protein
MANPLVITIEHGTTKAAARARLERSLGRIRAEAAPYVGSIEQQWRGEDAVDFRLGALGQTVTGSIEVEERVLRVVVQLPALLGFLGGLIAPRIRERGLKLLAGE